MYAKQVNPKSSTKVVTTNNGITVAGFLLFLTGAVLFSVAMIEILVQVNSLKIVLMIASGILLSKVGYRLIQHCATLKTRSERRRVISESF